MNKNHKISNNCTIELKMEHNNSNNDDYYKLIIHIDNSKINIEIKNIENDKQHSNFLNSYNNFINGNTKRLLGPDMINSGLEISINNNILIVQYNFSDDLEITSNHILI
jgi:hypothetical protein